MRVANNIGIQLNIVAFISTKVEVEAIDLCVVLGNLIDNSIEACEKIDSEVKTIDLTFRDYLGRLNITIENDCIASRILDKKHKKAAKDKYIHGFGIANIKEVVLKYHGLYDELIEDSKYTTRIIL